MTNKQAEQIAKLLNTQNLLDRKYDQNSILEKRDRLITKIDENGDVIGVAEVEEVQWYQAEIKHLSVDPKYQRKGIGRDLLNQAEHRAVTIGTRIAQCTIRDNNKASIKLFSSSGYQHTLTFVNRNTRNRVMVLQKVIQ
ncbi:GNAT family N-acetyltransferase [bacterium]|nr:GNAT family N-acetyltransferase [bacterium]